MHTGILAAVWLAVTPALAAAQSASPLFGTWSIEYERGRRMIDGRMTPVMGTGSLTIETRGDSLVATLTVPPGQGGAAPPPTVMAGKLTSGGGVFVQKGQMMLSINGERKQVESTVTWTLSASGDELSGTLLRELPGAPVQPSSEPARLKGIRAR